MLNAAWFRYWRRRLIRSPRRFEAGNGVYCDGCDVKGALTSFDNGRFYCARCAEEIEALGVARPC